MRTVRFRYNAAIAIAGLVAFFGAVPVATVHWYLSPILLVPIAVMAWGWRAGTDAGPDGLALRALFGSRRVPWAQVTGFAPAGRGVAAVLDGGTTVPLPAVTRADLPALVAASGQDLTPAGGDAAADRPEAAATDPAATDPAAGAQPSVSTRSGPR